jgi:hypothetical protein
MDKLRLRNTLKKLTLIAFDKTDPVNAALAPQEMLDFLAAAARIKPVYLLGRGFDDKNWIEGVLNCAARLDIRTVRGAPWTYKPAQDIKAWYYDAQSSSEQCSDVYYVTKSEATARTVSVLNSKGVPAEIQAELLGYPLCCVSQHYQKQSAYDRLFYMLLERHSQGDLDEAKRLISEDVQMTPQTAEELAIAEQVARSPVFAPFTSFTMCDRCIAQGTESPATIASRKMYEFSASLDNELTEEIARIAGIRR